MDANKLRVGHKILIDNQPYKIVDAMRRQQPRLAAKIIVKALNLLTGNTLEKTFTSGEEVPEANIERISAQYIYPDGDNYVFMNLDTSDQFELSKKQLGSAINFLVEGTDCIIVNFDERPIDVELPPTMAMLVESTEPGVKGDTVNNVLKPAVLETGFEVKVPMFINAGESIDINTETGEYKGRAKS